MKSQAYQKQQKTPVLKSKTIQIPIKSFRSQDTFKSQMQSNEYQSIMRNNNINNSKYQIRCGIDNKYLNSINYLSTCQFSKKRNLLYKLYCLMIRDYYVQFNHLYEKLSQKLNHQIDKHAKHNFLKQFKNFVYDFINIFKQVSTIQISYFSTLQEDFIRRQQNLEYNTAQFIQKLQVYKKSQLQFQVTSKLHNKELSQIYVQYENIKKDQKDPYLYYNRKQSFKKANQLLQGIKKQQQTRQHLRKDLDEVYQNSSQFQNNLILYRQQLFNNKYKIMKKLTQISKNSRNNLMQFLVYLFQCTSKKSQQFNLFIKNNHDSNLRKRSKSLSHTEDKLAVESFLIQVTNQYNRNIQDIQNLVKNVAQIFQELRKFNTSQIQNKNKILQLLNSVYDIDQNPDNQVSKTLNFYQDFCTKLFQINNGINLATNQFAKLKKQAKKLAQITLSLLRNSKTSIFQRSMQGSIHDAGHHSQIQILLQKLSYDYPITLIQGIYKDFQKNLSYLKNDASQKFHMKKRLMMDSMQISQFQDDTQVQPKKRICKKQIWLWQKWQNENQFKIDQFKVSSLAQIKEFLTKIIVQIPQAKQVDRFSCSLETKGQTSGFLIVTDKYIKFQTSQGNCLLTILLGQIEDVKIAVKIFGKIVSITTIYGSIGLRGYIDAQKIIQCIQQVRNSSGAPLIKPPRFAVQISVQELAYMQQRKNKISDQLPKLEEYSFQRQMVFENITIDHMYQLVYSDKQYNMRGKKQANFFAHTMKKNGSSNYQHTKYDSIGPKFYTHQEGVTFLNCPVFSTRIMNYDVKLPPVPFMPKYAHNREECKLFWISNEQFIYLIHNNASGAPKSDTFFLEILHKIQKTGQKLVKVSFYWRIVFTEDSFLKSTIQSSAGQQAKKGITLTIQQMKKYCQQMTSTQGQQNKGNDQNGKGQEQQKQQQTQKGQQGNGFIGSLIQNITNLINSLMNKGGQQNKQQKKQKPNKNTNVLLTILTVVLVLNLMVHFLKD